MIRNKTKTCVPGFRLPVKLKFRNNKPLKMLVVMARLDIRAGRVYDYEFG